ncbi:hypothetical protein B0H14DRAFT_2576908 [Mycena olivaceomarginata]|nr:hypothetical protein B0H14DRAFT_2576908 [Mycena olivaceomarginata]
MEHDGFPYCHAELSLRERTPHGRIPLTRVQATTFKLFSLPTLLLPSLGAIGVVVSTSLAARDDGCIICTQQIPQCNCKANKTCIIIPQCVPASANYFAPGLIQIFTVNVGPVSSACTRSVSHRARVPSALNEAGMKWVILDGKRGFSYLVVLQIAGPSPWSRGRAGGKGREHMIADILRHEEETKGHRQSARALTPSGKSLNRECVVMCRLQRMYHASNERRSRVWCIHCGSRLQNEGEKSSRMFADVMRV